ncbi:hypothetical protein D3C81_956660 [compost metagenome]
MLGQQVADGAQRRHLGHAPGVQDPCIKTPFEGLDHGPWCGGATYHHPVELQIHRRVQRMGLDELLQGHPDRGHAKRQGDPFVIHQLVETLTIELRAWQDQLRPTHRRRIRHAPGVDVEHRHHQQRRIRRGQAEAVLGA